MKARQLLEVMAAAAIAAALLSACQRERPAVHSGLTDVSSPTTIWR